MWCKDITMNYEGKLYHHFVDLQQASLLCANFFIKHCEIA